MELPGLAELLAPFDAQRFRDEILEQRPLFLQRDDPALHAGLPDLAAIENLIDYGWLEPHVYLRAVKDGVFADGALDPAHVRSLFHDGHTIVINSVSSNFPAIAALCRGLEIDLGCDVRANLYLTPPGAVGREPHFDLHDVVLLQLAGAKAWTVYAPQVELPLPSQRAPVDPDALGEPLLDVKLGRGDLLYMPRGVVHAGASEGISAHVTIGLHFYRWANLLADAVHAAAVRDPAMRRRVLREAAGPEGTETARAMLRAVVDGVDAGALLAAAARDRLERMKPLVDGWLGDDAARIEAESLLVRRAGQPCVVEGSALRMPAGAGMRGPPSIASALRFIAETDRPFRPSELPGRITGNSKIVVCRRLMREGLLAFAR